MSEWVQYVASGDNLQHFVSVIGPDELNSLRDLLGANWITAVFLPVDVLDNDTAQWPAHTQDVGVFVYMCFCVPLYLPFSYVMVVI